MDDVFPSLSAGSWLVSLALGGSHFWEQGKWASVRVQALKSHLQLNIGLHHRKFLRNSLNRTSLMHITCNFPLFYHSTGAGALHLMHINIITTSNISNTHCRTNISLNPTETQTEETLGLSFSIILNHWHWVTDQSRKEIKQECVNKCNYE